MSVSAEESLAAHVALPAEHAESIETFARSCVENIFKEMLRYPATATRAAPRRYRDEAVRARAERDIAFDVEQDLHLGFSHTAEEAATYRRRYSDAFLAAWRDPALWQACRAAHRPAGYIIVCMR